MDQMHPRGPLRQAGAAEHEQHAPGGGKCAEHGGDGGDRGGDVQRGGHADRAVFQRQRVERRLVGGESLHVVDAEAHHLDVGGEDEEQAGEHH